MDNMKVERLVASTAFLALEHRAAQMDDIWAELLAWKIGVRSALMWVAWRDH